MREKRRASMRIIEGALTVAGLLCFTSVAVAKVPEAEAAKLGKELTPLGAVQAGNASGAIPAWKGGITSPPAGYVKGQHHPDPFAGDKVRFTISSKNVGKYEKQLSPGQLAMFKRYPDTFTMNVYPTRRSASYSQKYYDSTMKNARTAELTNEGNGVRNASFGVPFPIPQNGTEAIWNHLLRYRGETVHRTIQQVAPTASGSYVPVTIDERAIWAYSQPGATTETIDNKYAYFLQEVTQPARLAGNVLLVHETLDQVESPRSAWTYNPGQRRVRRAPNVAYDNPGTAADAQRTSDQLDMFNGDPSRYTWELKGKREMYVPYNAYKMHSDTLKHDTLLTPGHLDTDYLRYELHRVWVVDATLRPETSHIYARRVFYIDEDSWQVLAVDQYDGKGNLWRYSEAYTINYYENPLVWETAEAHYDLQNGRYLVFGLNNEGEVETFDKPMELANFTPEALRRAGRR